MPYRWQSVPPSVAAFGGLLPPGLSILDHHGGEDMTGDIPGVEMMLQGSDASSYTGQVAEGSKGDLQWP